MKIKISKSSNYMPMKNSEDKNVARRWQED